MEQKQSSPSMTSHCCFCLISINAICLKLRLHFCFPLLWLPGELQPSFDLSLESMTQHTMTCATHDMYIYILQNANNLVKPCHQSVPTPRSSLFIAPPPFQLLREASRKGACPLAPSSHAARGPRESFLAQVQGDSFPQNETPPSLDL